MKVHKIMKSVIASLFAILLMASCEKAESIGGNGLKGYWMSDREYSGCKRVYYFDGDGGGMVYYYLSTSSTYWNRDCDCHRYNTEYFGTFNGTKYYKQKNTGAWPLIYTMVGTSLVVSDSTSDDLDYLNYSDGKIYGYSKVVKR